MCLSSDEPFQQGDCAAREYFRKGGRDQPLSVEEEAEDPDGDQLIRLPDGAAFERKKWRVKKGAPSRGRPAKKLIRKDLYQICLDIGDTFGNRVEGGTRSSVLFDEPVLQAGRFSRHKDLF